MESLLTVRTNENRYRVSSMASGIIRTIPFRNARLVTEIVATFIDFYAEAIEKLINLPATSLNGIPVVNMIGVSAIMKLDVRLAYETDPRIRKSSEALEMTKDPNFHPEKSDVIRLMFVNKPTPESVKPINEFLVKHDLESHVLGMGGMLSSTWNNPVFYMEANEIPIPDWYYEVDVSKSEATAPAA
jgi:hypothetical protein